MLHSADTLLKYKKLKRQLGMPEYQVKGALESIWHLTLRETLDGGIGRLSNEDIAACIEWEHDPDMLIESLVKTGWLDRCDRHRLVIHDWPDHCPRFVHGNLKRHGRIFANGSKPASRKRAKDQSAKSNPPSKQNITKHNNNNTSLFEGNNNFSPDPSFTPISDTEVKKILEMNKPR